jgi:hypothetical protein
MGVWGRGWDGSPVNTLPPGVGVKCPSTANPHLALFVHLWSDSDKESFFLQAVRSNEWECRDSLDTPRKISVHIPQMAEWDVGREGSGKTSGWPIKPTLWQFLLSSRKQSVWTAKDFCWLLASLFLHLVLVFALGIYGNSYSLKDISERMPINLGSIVSIFLPNYFPPSYPSAIFKVKGCFLDAVG